MKEHGRPKQTGRKKRLIGWLLSAFWVLGFYSPQAEALRQQDFYRFESDYIRNLNLYDGEDDGLKEQLELMKNSEKIYSAVNGAYDNLYEKDESVLSGLRKAIDGLQTIASLAKILRVSPRPWTRTTTASWTSPMPFGTCDLP